MTTSWTLKRAFRKPGIPPQIAPAPSEARRISGRWIAVGACTVKATAVAASEPTMSWPSAPMLKSPVLAAKAKASPVRMMGMDWITNSPMYRGLKDWPVARSIPETAFSIAANMESGDRPVSTMTIEPRRKPRNTAMSGNNSFSVRFFMLSPAGRTRAPGFPSS